MQTDRHAGKAMHARTCCRDLKRRMTLCCRRRCCSHALATCADGIKQARRRGQSVRMRRWRRRWRRGLLGRSKKQQRVLDFAAGCWGGCLLGGRSPLLDGGAGRGGLWPISKSIDRSIERVRSKEEFERLLPKCQHGAARSIGWLAYQQQQSQHRLAAKARSLVVVVGATHHTTP